jgi:hypothetical protein
MVRFMSRSGTENVRTRDTGWRSSAACDCELPKNCDEAAAIARSASAAAPAGQENISFTLSKSRREVGTFSTVSVSPSCRSSSRWILVSFFGV